MFTEALEETEGEGDPEDRREESEDDGVQNRFHLCLGRLTASHSHLHHGDDRPRQAFYAKPQGGPGPDGSDIPSLPQEKGGGDGADKQCPEQDGVFPHNKDADGDDEAAKQCMELRSPPRDHSGLLFAGTRHESGRSVRIARQEVNVEERAVSRKG